MKMMFLMVLVVFITMNANAQASKKLKPRANAAMGIMGGENEYGPAYQIGAGLALDRFYLGAGGGYDGHKFKSYPIFGDLRMDIGKRRLIFGYVNAGYNFSKKIKEDPFWGPETYSSQNGGFYFDGGAGFRIPIFKNQNIIVSAGYSQKKLSHVRKFQSFCIGGDCPDYEIEYRYVLNRITAKVSWELW